MALSSRLIIASRIGCLVQELRDLLGEEMIDADLGADPAGESGSNP